MKFTAKLIIAAVATLCLMPAMAAAEAPALIPIQGILTDSNGALINTGVNVTFTLYDASNAQLFREEARVEVAGGEFTHFLGSVQTLNLLIFKNNTDVALGVRIGNDAEMQPLLSLGSVPYAGFAANAANADNAAQFEGKTAAELKAEYDTAYVNAGDVDSIGRAMIKDNAINADKLAGAVPLYRVSNVFCENEVGTLMSSDKCRAYQGNVDSCSNACNGIRVRNCAGACDCTSFLFCLIGAPCDHRLSAPLCDNQLAGYSAGPTRTAVNTQ
ncbi:MAG: hypothetical protein H0U74_14065 [Bradymonadaceae bacterium]|nr:hypothetical protein [Lujinxingiaceae bacterium]